MPDEFVEVRRRDWIILPLVAAATLVIVCAAFEATARAVFPPLQAGLPSCIVRNNNPQGARQAKNSMCWERLAEERSSADYKFNDCGDRTEIACGAKTSDRYRIVLTGSSVAVGRYLPSSQSLTVLLNRDLSEGVHKPIEVYNQSSMQGFLDSVALRDPEFLHNQPDMLLWVVTPHDLEEPSFVEPANDSTVESGSREPSALKRAISRIQKNIEQGTMLSDFQTRFDKTDSSLLLRHLLYRSPSLYVKSFLMRSDSDTGFLRKSFTPLWQERVQHFDSELQKNQAWTSAAKVKLAVVFIPSRPQAEMLSDGDWPHGFDPRELNDELKQRVNRAGALYIDILPQFQTEATAGRLYFPVDGHPNEEGSAFIAQAIAQSLKDGRVASLTANSPL